MLRVGSHHLVVPAGVRGADDKRAGSAAHSRKRKAGSPHWAVSRRGPNVQGDWSSFGRETQTVLVRRSIPVVSDPKAPRRRVAPL